MIQTKTIALTPTEYFKIIVAVRMRKSWWLYLLLIVIAALLIKDFGTDPFATFLVVMAIISPILTVAQLYFFARNPKNKIVFIPRTYNIDNEHIDAVINGKDGAIPLSYIVDIIELNKYWLLYISTIQFLCIRKDAFYTDADYDEFKSIIASLKIKK